MPSSEASAAALAALQKQADVVLKSDAGITELYDLKDEEPLDGAQSGAVKAVDKRTGMSYALHGFELAEMAASKCEELSHAIAAQRRIAEPPADVGEEMRAARLACLREVLMSPQRVVLVCELAPTTGALCDDLLTLLQKRGRLSEPDARRVFTRVALATKRAHECGVVLRSIKPESVQVRQKQAGGEFEVCLAQLHYAAIVPGGEDAATLTGLHGTPEYAAPEVTIWYWHESVPPRLPEPPPPYGAKADLWALGMCLHVMLCGCFPFKTSLPEEELLRTINTAAFAFSDPGWKKISEEALDLVNQLLQRDPVDRPYLEEVLQHPFCAEALQEAMAADEASARHFHDARAYDAALAALDDDDDDDDNATR